MRHNSHESRLMQRMCMFYPTTYKSGIGLLKFALTCVLLSVGTIDIWDPLAVNADSDDPQRKRQIGREVAVAEHLQDDQEFRLSVAELLAHGKLLFSANWTEQEGGGRPLTKGTGRPLSDPSQ